MSRVQGDIQEVLVSREDRESVATDIQEVLVSREDRESVATAQKRLLRFIQATISYLPCFPRYAENPVKPAYNPLPDHDRFHGRHHQSQRV